MAIASLSAADAEPLAASQLVRGLGVWDVALITFGTLVGFAISPKPEALITISRRRTDPSSASCSAGPLSS